MQQKHSRQNIETKTVCYLHKENEIFVIARHATTTTTTAKLDI